MLHIEKLSDGLNLFKALGSDVRLEIVRLLVEQPMNMNELAGKLHITNGALTTHIKKLEECGVVDVSSDSGGHGNQKICQVVPDKLLINVKNALLPAENTCSVDLKVGRYSSCRVYPTCGLSTADRIIGVVDDYRYFSHPDHFDADILWFPQGSVGTWTSPGDFGDVRGIFTPDWWFPNWNQYGLLKMLTVNDRGAFMDGLKISDVSIRDLDLDQKPLFNLRFAVDYKAAHVGGLTIFGKTFGNYAQDIQVSLGYVTDKASARETAPPPRQESLDEQDS